MLNFCKSFFAAERYFTVNPQLSAADIKKASRFVWDAIGFCIDRQSKSFITSPASRVFFISITR